MSESRAIVARPSTAGEIDMISNLKELIEISKFLAAADLKDSSNPSVVMAKILAGRAWGFDAMSAIAGIHIINGKPEAGADLIAAAIRREGSGYDFELNECTDEACQVTFYRFMKDGTKLEQGKIRYTMKEAKDKGWHLSGKNVKDVWIKHPANMLYAAVMRDGKRRYCPDVLTSVAGIEDVDESTPLVRPADVQDAVRRNSAPLVNVVKAEVAKDPERPTELVVNDDGSLSDSVDAMTECRERIEVLQKEAGVSDDRMKSRLAMNFHVESIHELHDLPALQKLEQMLLSAKAARQKGKNGAATAITTSPTQA